MRTPSTTGIAFFLGLFALEAMAAERSGFELERRFTDLVHPFLQTYCFACHGPEKQKGKLDLSAYSTLEAVVSDYRRWQVVLEKLKAEEMPPEEAKRHPSPELRRQILDWVQAVHDYEARRNAGDPGPVLAHRLSSAEYDYSIRDLTGVDIRPAREFPVDPANEAGFDNSGESLAMSPSLLKKYLEAARRVADHLVLNPKGFVFAPHPVVTETDRDRYCVKRIVDFYERQPVDLADYFLTAWRFKYRRDLGQPKATLADLAAAGGISPKYLAMVWSTLNESPDTVGPMAELQGLWRELPAAGMEPRPQALARRGSEQMRDFVIGLRQKVKPVFTNLVIRGIAPGSQPFVLWKDRLYAAHRRHYAGATNATQGPAREATATNAAPDSALVLPMDEASPARHRAAWERFCSVFPDAFYVSERGLIFLEEDKESKGRLLSAGFHLMVGYFRDDAPLGQLILDERGQRELDNLWQELDFITLAPIRQYKDFIFFERAEPPRFMQGAEFDFARSEDKDAASAARIEQLAGAYLAKARRNGGEGTALNAIRDYFQNISAEIRRVEQARLAAAPGHLQTLQSFAQRAYRRPLSTAERRELLAFYHSLREKDHLSHEEALRDCVVSVLMSPHFCYRFDPPRPGRGVHPLSDYALASRLSYFLWSSQPDEELLACARTGKLHRRSVLVAQTRRLLRDERVRGLATEFGGNWLDFRRFEEHNSVDRDRFKSFNDELRRAMFEEPIRFFMDLVQEDRSVLDFLDADYTFVNPALARHYGMPELNARSNEWLRVNEAQRYERGGLLPMSVFLTKNAPGLRTSPVKRGYWVVRRLLGEQIPPPPPKVPELPNDEAKLGDLTLRETLARHREDNICAGCHARFDPLGLVFEGYGPIGERRANDLAGRPVDVHATFPGGIDGAGLAGLRRYIREHRQQEFLDNLCRKLLAYALGRTLLISDDLMIRDMLAKLETNGYRIGDLVECIVTSPQFLNQRGQDD